jgi:hypothetical protein
MAREEARAGIAVASPDALINVLRVRFVGDVSDITWISYHSSKYRITGCVGSDRTVI